jgi:hypothetical protein
LKPTDVAFTLGLVDVLPMAMPFDVAHVSDTVVSYFRKLNR